MELLSTLAIPAVVKLYELLNKKEWASAFKIVLAVLSGALAGFFGVAGLDIMTGIVAGLAASGIVTVAGYAGEHVGETNTPKQTK